MTKIENIASRNTLVAIGECGLDKVCKTDFVLQQEVFAAHIILANKLKKPLVLHCVKAYDEIIKMLSLHKNLVHVIFHGFNKNPLLA